MHKNTLKRSLLKEKQSADLKILQELLQKDPDYFLKKVQDIFHFDNSTADNLKNFTAYINRGYMPILYSNHQSHADGIILMVLIKKILKLQTKGLKGFLCPVAASMSTGDQDVTVQGGTTIFQPYFEKFGFILISVIREDDRIKYGMEGSNREAIEKLLFAPRDNYGLIVFPEGSVQGGRLRENGEIYGIRKVESGGILLRCISFWQSQGKKVVLLPVGIVNSYEVFNPDNYEISQVTMDIFSGKRDIKKVVSTKTGSPLTDEKIHEELGSIINPKNQEHVDYLMRKIAGLLPKNAQGYYT